MKPEFLKIIFEKKFLLLTRYKLENVIDWLVYLEYLKFVLKKFDVIIIFIKDLLI